MILETYKLSLSQLKVTCSTTVYKNLSLIIKICTYHNKEENRIYNIVNSTGLFDGQVILKGKPIDTVAFQLDTQRKKYLPKQVSLPQFSQIEFQLNLTYRTGKLNQKLYPINFNEFVMKKKGHYQKQIKITQRLYSFYVVIVARSTALDTILQSPSLGSLTRIRSEKRFDRHGSIIPQSETKKRYSKFHSPQQQTVIKYTINQNIKITRPQQINSTSILQTDILNEQKQTSILRQRFEKKQSQLSEMEQQKTRDQSSFISRNRVFTSRGRQPIMQRLDQYPTKGIITAVNNVGEKQKLSILEQKTLQLQQKLQQQQKRNYKLQKQLSGVKNKIQHLYHQKTILIREKQQQRLVFETKDKQEKMRQRRDIEQLRRVYEGQLRDKDQRIGKMEKEMEQIKYLEEKRWQDKTRQFNKKYEVRQRQLQEMKKQIILLNNKIRQLQQQLQQKNIELSTRKYENQPLTTPHHFIIHRHFLDEQSSSQHLNYTQSSSSQIHNKKEQLKQIKNNKNHDEQQIHDISYDFIRQQQLLQLMQQQTHTYNNMLINLQANLLKLQNQYKQQVQNNNNLIKEIQHLRTQLKQTKQQNLQKRTIDQIKIVHQQQISQYQRKIEELNLQVDTLRRNNVNNSKCLNKSRGMNKYDNNKFVDNHCPVHCLKRLNSECYHIDDHMNDHVHIKYHQNRNRAYSLSNIQQHYLYQPQTIKITTKSNTKYKITLYPQTQVIYIPPCQFIQDSKLGQSTGSEGYGKNYQLYQKNRQKEDQSIFKTGYFGVPLRNKDNHHLSNSNNNLQQNTQQYFTQKQQYQQQQQQLLNNLSCQNNYSYITKQQLQKQQYQYLNLIDQFQQTKNHKVINKINNNNKNNNKINNKNKNRSHSFYISSQIFDHQNDSIIINKQQDSYINQNGDYVKKSLIQVYQRNRINSIG